MAGSDTTSQDVTLHDSAAAEGAPRDKIGNLLLSSVRYSLVAYTGPSMQTLRKKNSPCKFKNEPSRFLGEGLSFKAKLIGILEVSEARGDRMCQAALADLKMAIRAAGEHKQRISVQVSIAGLRLRDEKTGDCLYHHPVHKISFIAQDMSDSRAFGYIFGSPDTGHRFFGIKTDKAASQVVIAMRDLFQVVFELKKKEIEMTKQHLEQNAISVIKFHNSGIFVESTPDTKGAAGTESSLRVKNTSSELDKPADKRNESQSGVIADLLDLQFELNSLQQGIHHMDKITPENQGQSGDDLFESDPFGDSFANMKLEDTVRPILPPPPSGSKRGHLERQQTVPGPQSSTSSSPAPNVTSKTPPLQNTGQWFDKEAETLFSENETSSSPKNTPVKKESEETQAKSPQIDVFTELDPLGTGLIKPYVDKKDFFQHLKNPPKKVLKDLVTTNLADTFPTNFNTASDPLDSISSVRSDSESKDSLEDSNFANFDRFDENEAVQSMFTRNDSPRKGEGTKSSHHQPLSVSLPPEDSAPKSSTASNASTSGGTQLLSRLEKDANESIHGLVQLSSPLKSARKKEFDMDMTNMKAPPLEKAFPVDFSTTTESPASPLKSCSSDPNSRLSSSSAELELVPEPPPRAGANIVINPPPLPPKKQGARGGMKPPPRPPHSDAYFHYDFPARDPIPVAAKDRSKSPPKETKGHFDDNFSPPIQLSSKSDLIGSITTSTFEDSFSSMVPTTNLSTFFTSSSSSTTTKKTKPSLDITLSQLTSSNLKELANSLGMTVQELTSLTLQQLTECLATLSNKETANNDKEDPVSPEQEPVTTINEQPASSFGQQRTYSEPQPFVKTSIEQETKPDTTYDKYAVFRELLELEQMERNEESMMKDSVEDEASSETTEQVECSDLQQEMYDEDKTESLTSLAHLTVKLPPSNEDLANEESFNGKIEETSEVPSNLVDENQPSETETKLKEDETVANLLSQQFTTEIDDVFERRDSVAEVEENVEEKESPEKTNDFKEDYDKPTADSSAEDTNGTSIVVSTEVKSSVSTYSDKYAALREIIGEPEPPKQNEEEISNSTQVSPGLQPSSSQSKGLAEVELLNLFSDPPPSSSSPKKQAKKDDDIKTMDIFEEIKMLSSGTHTVKATKSTVPDIFCPFTEMKQDDSKDDNNWAKFDTELFPPERPPCEEPPSIRGPSPGPPEDEEESEESNGRIRGDNRFWCNRHPRFDAPAFPERAFYDETGPGPGNKRDRSFRDRMMKKPREGPWMKNPAHRPRDPSSWHEDSQWEEESRRYPHRKMPYKDEEDQYEAHWKCRSQAQRWNWPHEPFYDDERKRKLALWNDEERFGSQESMGYDEDDRWFRRKYERRRWEEDTRFWNRRPGPPDADYPTRESYYYYREGRERPHDYPPPSAWDEEYASDRPADDSPRYNLPARKRHWPKRPNSANEGRNADIYAEPRKFGTSRSECSDNDSDAYLRPSQRSRSRESYWDSDQEYDSWVERPYWSEGPDTKSESLHRKRIPRHKPRPPHPKVWGPFVDVLLHGVEHADPSTVESLAAVEPCGRSDSSEQKPPSISPPFSKKSAKDLIRKEIPKDYNKRSSYFEDDLTPTASASSDASDRQRLPSDLKATPEELPCDSKDVHQATDGFASEDNGRDSFFNGDLRYDDDDAFTFKSELEDNVPDHRVTALPLKNHSRQGKYSAGNATNNNNNNKSRSDQYIRKSESVNIFARENDPFDDDDFFN